MRSRIIVIVISLLILFADIGLMISMRKIDRQTENTTKFYEATIADVRIINTGKNVSVEISTKEYDTNLYISENVCKNIDINYIKNLSNGQAIYFGIQKIKAKHINKAAFVDITSLKVDTKDILSIEKYNESVRNSVLPARIAGIVILMISLFVLLLCCRKRGTHRNTGNGSVC